LNRKWLYPFQWLKSRPSDVSSIYVATKSHWGGGATGSDVTISGPDQKCSRAHALIFLAFFYFLTIVVVQNVGTRDQRSRDPEGVLLGARMRNGFPVVFFGCFDQKWPDHEGVPLSACATGSWGFPYFFRMFLDMLCSIPRPRSHCVVFLFDSLSHPIEGQSAFIQACDWLYI
jgi:hypothetical protein